MDFSTGNASRNVVGQAGMAFTALTRAELWAKVAFRNLPPLMDVFAVRGLKMFKAREAFEQEILLGGLQHERLRKLLGHHRVD